MKRTAMKLAAIVLAASTALTPLTAAAETVSPDISAAGDIPAVETLETATETENETEPASEAEGFDVDSLTLQPGETTESINLNWYAPDGTENAVVKFEGLEEVRAAVSELSTPTKLDTGKYTDTGKMVCKATVSGLTAGTTYTYQISNDGGATWSRAYTYTTPEEDSFTFAFTSDPQIKEDQSHDDQGWNSSDGTNQTGWATMMEKISEEGASLVVSAGDQVEDQSWGKSSEYEAFFAPEEMASIAYAPAVGNHDRHYMFDDHFNLPNEMKVQGCRRERRTGTGKNHLPRSEQRHQPEPRKLYPGYRR